MDFTPSPLNPFSHARIDVSNGSKQMNPFPRFAHVVPFALGLYLSRLLNEPDQPEEQINEMNQTNQTNQINQINHLCAFRACLVNQMNRKSVGSQLRPPGKKI
jgi:hypothetical protein